MTSNYELVGYEPELKRQIIELQSHLWSPSAALNTAYFEWKYERNPYIDAPLIYLAMHDGSAVGMRGFFGTQWTVGLPAQRFIAPYADDLVIAPEHRNNGLIARIMAFAFEDLAKRNYHYAVSLSPGAMTFLSSIAAGWRSPGLLRPMRRRPWRVALRRAGDRIVKPLPLLAGAYEAVVRPWIGARRLSLADIDAERVRRCTKDMPRIVFEDAPRCSAMAELVDSVSASRIRHVRDAAYFDWRFRNPLSRYRFLFWANPRLEGYLVLQECTSAYAVNDVVNVVDWEATSAAVQAELLGAATRLITDRNLVIWSASLSRELTMLLDESGFKVEPAPRTVAQQRHTLLVRPVGAAGLNGDWLLAGRRLLDLDSWDLRMLYSTHG
ncbi:MAG: GNAT family N-acetyltransferase [Steroidobacteraceae bacterium]